MITARPDLEAIRRRPRTRPPSATQSPPVAFSLDLRWGEDEVRERKTACEHVLNIVPNRPVSGRDNSDRARKCWKLPLARLLEQTLRLEFLPKEFELKRLQTRPGRLH